MLQENPKVFVYLNGKLLAQKKSEEPFFFWPFQNILNPEY